MSRLGIRNSKKITAGLKHGNFANHVGSDADFKFENLTPKG